MTGKQSPVETAWRILSEALGKDGASDLYGQLVDAVLADYRGVRPNDMRDEFAKAALGVIPGDVADAEGIAHDAYTIADAMLRRRRTPAPTEEP